MTTVLFPRLDPMLPWLAGESLFSLCSRHHRLWGHGLSARSTEIMFGHRRLGTQHDFPSGLDAFVVRTEHQLGSAYEIARDKTLLKFYRTFLADAEVGNIVATMRGPTVAHLKFRLGLLTSRFRANHPLKACLACMREDLLEAGWVYWHLIHQYPGVWLCPQHLVPLHVSTVKSTGVERFLWCLPSEAQLVECGASSSAASLEAQFRLTNLTIALVDCNAADGWLNADAVQEALRFQLLARGWLTPAGNARLSVAAADYLQRCAALRGPEELNGLPSTLGEAKAQLGRIIRPLRSGVHPLRLLIAIDWLFGGISEFLAIYQRVDKPGTVDEAVVAPDGLNEDRDNLRARLGALMAAGASATNAASQVGVDVGTAMAWAAASGVQVARRPKVLISAVRQSIVNNLRIGADKSEVARSHGLSISTISRLLRTEVGLHAAWKVARFETARSKARGAWQAVCTAQLGAGPKMLRAMDPASYAWLYRNDRAWLTDHLPEKGTDGAAARQGSVRWDERDMLLSVEVEQAAERIAVRTGQPLLQLWQIYQAVPRLKPKLRALDRLPLTKRALERALAPRRSRAAMDLFADRDTRTK